MTHDDCMLLMDAYRDAVCLERNLGSHAGLQPAAKRIVENLQVFIGILLETSVIGDQKQETNHPYIMPVYVDSDHGWDHGPVTCKPTVTWTNTDTLDEVLS